MKTIARLFPGLVLFLIPTVASAAFSIGGGASGSGWSFGFGFGSGNAGAIACASNNICQVASTIIFIINSVLVPLLFAVAFIMFIYGVARAYIFSGGSEEAVSGGHKLILWGIIGFVVMISLWGLVNVVSNTFGLAGVTAPPTPRSY